MAAAELVVRVHDFVLVRAVPGRALVGDELGFFLAGFDDLAAARVGGCEGGEEGGEEEENEGGEEEWGVHFFWSMGYGLVLGWAGCCEKMDELLLLRAREVSEDFES